MVTDPDYSIPTSVEVLRPIVYKTKGDACKAQIFERIIGTDITEVWLFQHNDNNASWEPCDMTRYANVMLKAKLRSEQMTMTRLSAQRCTVTVFTSTVKFFEFIEPFRSDIIISFARKNCHLG
jgi:hypothetical protein